MISTLRAQRNELLLQEAWQSGYLGLSPRKWHRRRKEVREAYIEGATAGDTDKAKLTPDVPRYGFKTKRKLGPMMKGAFPIKITATVAKALVADDRTLEQKAYERGFKDGNDNE